MLLCLTAPARSDRKMKYQDAARMERKIYEKKVLPLKSIERGTIEIKQTSPTRSLQFITCYFPPSVNYLLWLLSSSHLSASLLISSLLIYHFLLTSLLFSPLLIDHFLFSSLLLSSSQPSISLLLFSLFSFPLSSSFPFSSPMLSSSALLFSSPPSALPTLPSSHLASKSCCLLFSAALSA